MNKPTYIHYGSANFHPEGFTPITNSWFTKPDGGLWASLDDEKIFSWKRWCDREEFRDCESEPYFKFTLKDSANVHRISNLEDLKKLPKIETNSEFEDSKYSSYYIDFEKCLDQGIDAIELRIFSDWDNADPSILYWKLYGWDCDCILILKPDCIERTW